MTSAVSSNDPKDRVAEPSVPEETVEAALEAHRQKGAERTPGRPPSNRARMAAALNAAFPALVARCAELEGERDALRGEVERLDTWVDYWTKAQKASCNRAEAAERKVEALRAEAERWRYIEEHVGFIGGEYYFDAFVPKPKGTDGAAHIQLAATIDAARAGGQEDGHSK